MRGDYFGPAVHRAARVVAVAVPRTVLVAAEVGARVAGSALTFESVGTRTLAGFDRPVELLRCRRSFCTASDGDSPTTSTLVPERKAR